MYRIGFGYDSHRFAPKRVLMLGGVRIDGSPGLDGHSDADAVLHAITDAILGAAGEGDIGEHFPDTDDRWAGADSSVFVAEALRLAALKGYIPSNCDVTVVADSPKLQPHKQKMRERIAELLGLEIDAVSVKGKTNEGMGFAGRGEGLAVMAAVMLRKLTQES